MSWAWKKCYNLGPCSFTLIGIIIGFDSIEPKIYEVEKKRQYHSFWVWQL